MNLRKEKKNPESKSEKNIYIWHKIVLNIRVENTSTRLY